MHPSPQQPCRLAWSCWTLPFMCECWLISLEQKIREADSGADAGPRYGCIVTVTGGLPGKNNVPVLLLRGTKTPAAPPPLGMTVAYLPWLEVTVPARPKGPKIGVPRRSGGDTRVAWPGTDRGLACNGLDGVGGPCEET